MEGIKAKAYPGCQILILKDGKPVYDKSFGTFTYESDRQVEKDDLYDLASLTTVSYTHLDSRDIVWISTYGNGLFAYDLATDELQHFESNINGFSHITSNFLQYIKMCIRDREKR